MSLELLVTLIAVVTAATTAMFVLLKDHKRADNFYFAILAICIGLYSTFNYLAVNSTNSIDAFAWTKLVMISSMPQGLLLLFFASTVKTKRIVYDRRLQLSLIAWLIVVWALTISGFIFKSVTINKGLISINPGPLIPLFALVHIGSMIRGGYLLIKTYRGSVGVERKQLKYVTYGLLSSYVLTFLTTLVLPLVFKSTFLLAVSPVFLSLSLLFTAYAIIAHKFFDIRAAMARSVAFIIVVVVVTGLFASSIIFASKLLFGNDVIYKQLLVSTIMAMLLAFLFGYIRKGVEKFTDKVFFRESYDPQLLLSELNAMLVNNIELDAIASGSTTIIQGAMKSTGCILYIDGTTYSKSRTYGENRFFEENETQFLISNISKVQQKVFLVDNEVNSSAGENLTSILQLKGINILIKISSDNKKKPKTIGYIALGPKRNGTKYTEQDIRIMGIMSNELYIAIENSLRFEEIAKFNVNLQKKIEEATRELLLSNQKLKALDEAKDEFISMASHQLRTPLTSVKGYVSMVLEGDAGELNDMQKRLLEQAFTSSQRMVYLIADLLNVSRLKTGKFIIEKKPTNLAEVVQGEIDQLRETAKGRNLVLSYDKPADFPDVDLDETKTRQVIMNFIDNAIYYTPAGGHIDVNLKQTAKGVELTVNDDGLGVPKAEQHHLFAKFYRAGNARKVRPDGTGLGLFMAKKVIVAQGGAIIFKSKEGKGSTFGFTFQK